MKVITNYIPLKSLLARVYAIIEDETFEEDFLLQWSYELLTDLLPHNYREPVVYFVKFNNFKVKLPVELTTLKAVYFKDDARSCNTNNSIISDADVSNVIQTCGEIIIEGCNNIERNMSIKLGSNNDSCRKVFDCYWTEMRLKNPHAAKWIDCGECKSALCKNEYGINVKEKSIITNLSKGKLAIEGYRLPIDEESELLIPEEESLLEALENHLKEKITERTIFRKIREATNETGEATMLNRLNTLHSEYKLAKALAMRRFKGDAILEQADLEWFNSLKNKIDRNLKYVERKWWEK